MVKKLTQTQMFFRGIKWATIMRMEICRLIQATTMKWMLISTIKLWQREKNNEIKLFGF